MMKDMKVAEVLVDADWWGNEGDPKSDWSLAKLYNTFSHSQSCEFIFYVGDNPEYYETAKQIKREQGFSEKFLEVLDEARSNGFKYVCIYS